MSIVKIYSAIVAMVLAGAALANEVAFTGVNVLTMHDESVLADQTVLVSGDRITALGPRDQVGVPEGATIIEGRGQYLLPGLAEMHGHTPVPQGDVDHPLVADMMFLYIANGVTTVRGMLGARGQLELRRRIRDGDMEGPSLFLAGPSFNGNSVSSPAQARQKVRQVVEQGWDLLKVHPGLTRGEYDAMAEEAHRLGIRFAGHVPEDVGLNHALSMGQDTFDHIDGYLQQLGYPEHELNQESLRDLAVRTRDSRAWVVPTMVLWDHLIGLGDPAELSQWPELKYWPSSQVETWERRQQASYSSDKLATRRAYSGARSRVLAMLDDVGAGILLGTDSPQVFSVPGFSIHREMAAMVNAGMSPYAVLRSGTSNVGHYLQGVAAVGVIAPGMRADLILTPSNPMHGLETLLENRGVMVRGRWYDQAEINARLKGLADRIRRGEKR